MVVRVALSEVKMYKGKYVDVRELRVPENVSGNEIKIISVKCEFFVKLSTDVAEVAELVHECRPFVEALVVPFSLC